MTAALAGYLIGAFCYGVSSVYSIRFSNQLTVPIAAALAPAVAWSGLNLEQQYGLVVLAAGPVVSVIAMLVRHKQFREFVSHLMLFLLASLVLVALPRTDAREVLAPALVAGAVYLLGDFLRQRRDRSTRVSLVSGDGRTYWLLQAVLICGSGLTVLGVQQMQWPAFAAMAFVLVITKHEFEAFAKSRTAYEQTLRAVGKLKEQDRQTSLGWPELVD